MTEHISKAYMYANQKQAIAEENKQETIYDEKYIDVYKRQTVSCTITSTRDNLIARGTLDNVSTLKAGNIKTNATILQGCLLYTSHKMI